MKRDLFSLVIVISLIVCSGLKAQTDQKSLLRQKFDRDRAAMQKLWQQRLAAFEQEFNRSRENIRPFQEKELIKDGNNAAIASVETDMDSNYVIIEAIAVGKDKQETVDLVEKTVMSNLLQKAKEITHCQDAGQIAQLQGFLKEHHIPLIKKLTPISLNQVQARFKVKQPLLGSKGLLQFVTKSTVSRLDRIANGSAAELPQSGYTGLIVDVRKLNVKPNLIIYIKHQDETLYGPSMVDRDQALKKGMARWYRSMAEARADPRAGAKPFVLIPTAVEENRVYRVNFSDQKILVEAGFRTDILRNCQVIIVK